MQLSCGQLLTPVQTLVSTFVFLKEKRKRVLSGVQYCFNIKRPNISGVTVLWTVADTSANTGVYFCFSERKTQKSPL
jgi:hypothetical protein